MFGLWPAILLVGLMTPMQCDNAREGLLRAIQDELDSKNPTIDLADGILAMVRIAWMAL